MDERAARPLGEARRRGLLLIWGAQWASLVLFVMITRLVEIPASSGDASLLLLVLGLVGLSAFGMSFAVKPKLLAQSFAQGRPDLATTAYVLAFALCEASALLGLVAHFTTGARESLYLFAPSALGLLLHFPRREHFAESPAGFGGRS